MKPMSLMQTASFASLAEQALFMPAAAPLATQPGAWTLRATLASVVSLVLFTVAAGSFWYFNDSVVPWDSKNQFYPFFRFLADSLQNGEVPFWNRYHFGGHPSIADPQSLIFTPTMVLLAVLAPKASMMLFDAVVLAHLCGGGLGVLGLFARRGWHPSGAVLAAIVFMFAGPASSRLQHTGMIISYAFFPLALWALEAALDRRSYLLGLLFACLAAFMALGRDQVAFLCCGVLIFAVVWKMLADPAPLAWLRRRWLLLGLMAVAGAAIMIVPVLLTMQFLGASNRPGISYGVAVTGSMTPVNFVTMLIPNIFGTLNWNYSYWGPGYETTLETNWTDRAINYLFIGTLPAVLVLWHGVACGRMFSPRMRFFTGIGVFAAVYAVGRYTPLFGFIFDHVPGVSLYRRPADSTFRVNFALATGAGYLMHRYIADGLPHPWRDLPRPLAWGLFAALFVAGAATLSNALELSATWKHLDDALRSTALAAGMAAVAAAVLIAPRTARQRGIMAALAVFATMGELIWRDARSSLNAEPVAYYSIFDKLNPTETAGLFALRSEIAAQSARGEFPRVEILGLSGPWQNAAMVLGLEDTLGYNPLRIAEYERAVGPGENAGDPNLRQFPGTFRGYKSKLAKLLGLEYLVLDRPMAKLPRHFPRAMATPVFSGEGFHVYRLGKPAPRAYLATQIIPVDSEAVLDEHQLPEFDRSHQALIEQSDMAAIGAIVKAGDPNPAIDPHVVVVAHHGDDVVIEVDSDRPGIVVLHDLYYPGWVARVDGVVSPLLRANVLFRGVEVAAGRHVVEFTFEPLSPGNLAAAAAGLLRRNEE